MPNQFLSDEFGDIEDYFVTDYRLIDNFVGDTLWVWGQNSNSQLGLLIQGTPRSTPVTTFAGGTTWKQVSAGNAHTAAIKTDGTLWTWGNGTAMGDNTTTTRNTPVTTFAGGTDWKQVSAGGFYTSAIKTDGSLWTWGLNTYGQLGDNTTTSRSTPVTTFAGGNTWKQVSCGEFHITAIKTDGTLWTWGRNHFGQLGINDAIANNRTTPVTTFAGGTNWKQVDCNDWNTTAVKTDGSLWTWGRAFVLGINQGYGNNRTTPVTTFAGGNTWKSVSCGADHVLAIKTDLCLLICGVVIISRL